MNEALAETPGPFSLRAQSAWRADAAFLDRFDIVRANGQILSMAAHLNIADFGREVAEKAKAFDGDVTPDLVYVYEDADSANNGALIVQVAAKRSGDREAWTRQRLRFSQAVRDLLLMHGDDRFPIVQIFAPEEWARRNG
uniref:hypothetical protein n=1 Tax=uncultured Caulobacter sp. TaxID=158749 RepID=UPI0025D16952|nr:hypothetical protein [uncultured Caulobacter sp.]